MLHDDTISPLQVGKTPLMVVSMQGASMPYGLQLPNILGTGYLDIMDLLLKKNPDLNKKDAVSYNWTVS